MTELMEIGLFGIVLAAWVGKPWLVLVYIMGLLIFGFCTTVIVCLLARRLGSRDGMSLQERILFETRVVGVVIWEVFWHPFRRNALIIIDESRKEVRIEIVENGDAAAH